MMVRGLLKKWKNNQKESEYQKWCRTHLWPSAGTVRSYFHGYKYIIRISNHEKLFDMSKPGWEPNDEFKKYLYPSRPLGENCSWLWARGYYLNDQFVFDDMGGTDELFVATNYRDDLIMISLKWAN